MSDTTATTTRGQVRTEPGAKGVRAYLGGDVVADTIRPVLDVYVDGVLQDRRHTKFS